MGKVYTIGLRQANKCMKLAATAYNLKKWLIFTIETVKSGAGVLTLHFATLRVAKGVILSLFRTTSGQVAIHLAN
jgi:hypothetical protein